jgi:hypothetical protein
MNAALPLESEATECGEQTLVPGVKPVTLRERLAFRLALPLTSDKTQKPMNLGLFDEDARKQLNLF